MLLFLSFACRSSDPTTLVDELRIIAIQSQPAEIGMEIIDPNEPQPQANLLISDPLERGGKIAYWVCTNFGEGCLEANFYAETPNQWIQFTELTDLLTTVDISIHPAIWNIVAEQPTEQQPFIGSALWVMACEPNLCPIIEQLSTDSYDLDGFSNPFQLMENIALTGSSMAFRPLYLSTRTIDKRINNPTVTPLFDLPITVKNEESTDLPFAYEMTSSPNDDSIAYAYTTLGGFQANDRLNNLLRKPTGEITMEWFGPEKEKGSAEIYMIIEDGSGGTAIWTGEGEVQ